MTDSPVWRGIRRIGHWATSETMWRVGLTGVLVVSATLNLYRLNTVGINGFGNPYYAAGVKSMLMSWHNLFYLSFDPAGFLSMDKAPLGLWLQAACAWAFGFHGLSLLLPQALAGVASVYVLYRLLARAYGAWPGLLSALILAVMPISVVTARNNTPDSLLVLVLLLAAWALLRAVEEGSFARLALAAVLVGTAFNVKMLQLLLVLPGLAILYLVASALPWRRRLLQAGGALLIALVVGLTWVAAVELTPAAQRPYVGGSSNNRVLDLIVGYNGLMRIWGQDWSYYLGRPGPLRLANERLGGQVSWLLPLAIVGGLLAAWQAWRQPDSPRRSRQRQALILWWGWVGVQVAYFSASTFYHRYYLATLAPGVAALAGIGTQAVVAAWRAGGRQRSVTVTALVLSAGAQVALLWPFPPWRGWMIPLIATVEAAAVAVLLAAWPAGNAVAAHRSGVALAGGIAALLVTPTVWSAIPVATCMDCTLPYGGPQVVGASSRCKPFESRPFLAPELVTFLLEHRDGARYLAATYDLGIAELGILETGEPFMALGGYRGSDPILSKEQFAQYAAQGEVRFFLSMMTADAERWPVQEEIRRWAKDHCSLAPAQMGGVEVRGPCSPD